VRRQVQVKAINPKTADELAGFFREVSYTLTDVRLGEAVPAIKVERVPDDLVRKDGSERKALFITALLPVILEVNQRVMAEREELLFLRDKLRATPACRRSSASGSSSWPTATTPAREARGAGAPRRHRAAVDGDRPERHRIGLGHLVRGAHRQRAVRPDPVGRPSRVSVPWKPGSGMPQPFNTVGEAADAYVINLNTHPAYNAFRVERAAMRGRGESARRLPPDRPAAALFGARPSVRRLRPPGHARGQARPTSTRRGCRVSELHSPLMGGAASRDRGHAAVVVGLMMVDFLTSSAAADRRR
jgi:Bax protein